MTRYKLEYTTPYGLEISQEFPDKESRDKAFELIGRTERIYAPGSVVCITNHIICIQAVDEDVENTADDFVGEKDCAES